MSQFSGRQGRGAMRHRKETKRIEAELRNEEYQARKLEELNSQEINTE